MSTTARPFTQRASVERAAEEYRLIVRWSVMAEHMSAAELRVEWMKLSPTERKTLNQSSIGAT